MEIDLAGFDLRRIESIKKLTLELYGEADASDWVVVSTALRIYEHELKRALSEKKGSEEK